MKTKKELSSKLRVLGSSFLDRQREKVWNLNELDYFQLRTELTENRSSKRGVVFIFYRGNSGKVKFVLYRTINESNFGFVMGSRKTDGYSISQIRNQKSQTSMVSLGILNWIMNWSIPPILGRDWRDSNPQLPPWQGGALTDWTTIPGK